jgi:hypothetical protein
MTKKDSRLKVKLKDLEIKSDCATCVHKSIYFATCKAFPNGIPKQLLSGELQHRTPFQGDSGIMYEPIKEK